MKKALTVITLISALLFLSMPAFAGPPEPDDTILVVGKDDPTKDVVAVQNAVDVGGKILLIGTFNFNFEFDPPGFVTITKDVQIHGETDNKGTPLTTILGGSSTFRSRSSTDPPPIIGIHGIHFIGPELTPISLWHCGGAEIRGNKIEDIIPADFFGMPRVIGVFLGWLSLPFLPPPVRGGLVTGEISVMDNEIDMDPDLSADPLAEPSDVSGYGVMLSFTKGVTADISNNTVRNASRAGVGATDNSVDDNDSGIISIGRNEIITADIGFHAPHPGAPNGILAGNIPLPSGLPPLPYKEPRYVISKNYIEMNGRDNGATDLKATAIIVLADEAIVKRNHIVTCDDGFNSGVRVAGSRCFVTRNKIEGEGTNALLIAPFYTAPDYDILLDADENVLQANNISNFDEVDADVVFRDADNNILVGGRGTVKDLGINNTIKGNFDILP